MAEHESSRDSKPWLRDSAFRSSEAKRNLMTPLTKINVYISHYKCESVTIVDSNLGMIFIAI